MGRPRGSKNRPKTERKSVGNPIPGGANEPAIPDTSPAPDAVATAETLAPGPAPEGGETAPALSVGDRVRRGDRGGTVTGVEPRGECGPAVGVQWDGDDEPTSYTPIDWQEMGATVDGAGEASCATAPTEPAPASTDEPTAPETTYGDDDEPQPPVGIGSRLAEIGHEWADTDQQLVAKEAEKSTVVKQYTKEIDILESRCRQLAAEYREAEWPETFDYRRGLKHVWNGRTGRLARTDKLGSYQVPLDLDHPSKPPVEVTSDNVVEVLAEVVAEAEAEAVLAIVGPAEQLEPTPFDESESSESEAVEA